MIWENSSKIKLSSFSSLTYEIKKTYAYSKFEWIENLKLEFRRFKILYLISKLIITIINIIQNLKLIFQELIKKNYCRKENSIFFIFEKKAEYFGQMKAEFKIIPFMNFKHPKFWVRSLIFIGFIQWICIKNCPNSWNNTNE